MARVFRAVFDRCALLFFLSLFVMLGLMEQIEMLFFGPPERPARLQPEERPEPDEWDKLSPEEQAELKRYFR